MLTVSDSLWLHGLQPARLLYPWNSPGNDVLHVLQRQDKGRRNKDIVSDSFLQHLLAGGVASFHSQAHQDPGLSFSNQIWRKAIAWALCSGGIWNDFCHCRHRKSREKFGNGDAPWVAKHSTPVKSWTSLKNINTNKKNLDPPLGLPWQSSG